MKKMNSLILALVIAFLPLIFMTGCGTGSTESTPSAGVESPPAPVVPASTSLQMMDDESFNALSEEDRIYVAKKLYSTFYKGKAIGELKQEIDSGKFISDFWRRLHSKEVPQPDLNKIFQDNYTIPYDKRRGDKLFEKRWRIFSHIASTLYYTRLGLDFYNEWMAYVMEQSILFSPAYEVESVTPFPELIASNHERLVRDIDADKPIKEVVFNHMISKENWARFRSPEDNAREMLEIWLYDYDDTHVPLGAKALKNWRWVIAREKNSEGVDGDVYKFFNDFNNAEEMNDEPISLFGTEITTGLDFYRSVVNHPDFIPTVVDRVVNIFFPTFSTEEKRKITDDIVDSKPLTFRDIFDIILFSKNYLLKSDKLKSPEEIYMGFAHLLKMEPSGEGNFRYFFTDGLGNSNQLALTYKLGRADEGVSDSDSVIRFHQYLRTNIFLNRRSGWNSSDIINRYDHSSFKVYLNELFLDIVGRKMSESEEKELISIINDAGLNNSGDNWSRLAATLMTFDYFSRLSEIYTYIKVNEKE